MAWDVVLFYSLALSMAQFFHVSLEFSGKYALAPSTNKSLPYAYI